jgi:hypothetical protein
MVTQSWWIRFPGKDSPVWKLSFLLYYHMVQTTETDYDCMEVNI